MNLHTIKKLTGRKKKRLGQGHGSGRVKTSGRGTKGQKARRSIPLFFEGGAVPLIKRLPFRRGKGKNKSFKNKPVVINIKALQLLPENSIVDLKTLLEYKIVDSKDAEKYGVKLLGDGEVTQAYTVKIPVSKRLAEKIRSAGGSVESI